MRREVNITLVYVDGRLLVSADIAGTPSNVVDLLAETVEEVDHAIGTVMRATRKQIIRLLVQETA